MQEKGYEVLGFFVHKDDKELNSHTVMVVIDEGYKRLTCYAPMGQHSEMDRGYFTECQRISKKDYIQVSNGLHTPSDYLEFDYDRKVLSLDDWRNIFRNLKDLDKEDYYDGETDWVEVLWLDSPDEWALCYGEGLFEDGFESEQEAQERLNFLENLLLDENGGVRDV